MTDGALLILIIDDQPTIRVLAAWGAHECMLDDIDDPATHRRLSDTSGVPYGVIKSCLTRLRSARVLVDGGISDLADKMLQTCVQLRLDASKKKR